MLNSLRNWGKKISSSRMLCADLEATIYDPREMPRPLRPDTEDAVGEGVECPVENKNHAQVDECRVDREQLSECVVCWEAIRGAGPALGCPSCNKLICGMCAPRLTTTCPFCREPLPYETKANRHRERFSHFCGLPSTLYKLSKRLREDFFMSCPFQKLTSCKWKHRETHLSSHLLNDHSTQLIESDTFLTNIHDLTTDNQICSFVLHHHSEYLLCQLSKINNEQIGLSFSAMPKKSFSVLITIKNVSNRTLRGMVFFPSSKCLTNKEFNFSWNRITPDIENRELTLNFKLKPM